MLRKKVEELEENCDILKRKTSDLQEKLLSKEQKVPRTSKQKDFAKVSLIYETAKEAFIVKYCISQI